MSFPVRDPDFEALRLEHGKMRGARGWIYEDMAERSEASRRTLIAMETGTTNRRVDSGFRVAQDFEANIGDLLKAF